MIPYNVLYVQIINDQFQHHLRIGYLKSLLSFYLIMNSKLCEKTNKFGFYQMSAERFRFVLRCWSVNAFFIVIYASLPIRRCVGMTRW